MDLISFGAALKKSKAYTDTQIATLATGMIYKGSITFANLPTASSSNSGWVYTVTDKNNHEYLSDGTTWLDLGQELDQKQDTLDSSGANANVIAPLYVDTGELRLSTGNGLQKVDDMLEVKPGTGIVVNASGVNVDTDTISTHTWVENKGYLTQHQSLAAYRTSANQDTIDTNIKNTIKDLGDTFALDSWQQLIRNGNFTIKNIWQGNNCGYDVANNIATVEDGSSGAYFYQDLLNDIPTGHCIYLSLKLRADSSGAIKIRFESSVGTSGVFSKDVTTSFVRIPLYWTPTTLDISLVGLEYISTTPSTIYVKEFMLFDLTDIYGAGNEPSQSEFENILSFGTYYPHLPTKLVPVTYSGISVSVIPTALSSYNTWDTEQKYGYKAEVTITGLTTNSMIENLIMSDTIYNIVAPICTTSANTLTFYTEDSTALSGTIITLITSEVA